MGIGVQYFGVTMIGTYPGANPILAYLITAIMVFGSAIATYLLSVAMPRSGGPYIHVSRVLHPALGYLTGWSYLIYLMFSGIVLNAIVGPALLSAGLTAAGYVAHSPGLIAVGATLVDPAVDLALAIAVFVIYFIIMSLGSTAFKWLMHVIFWIPFVGIVFTMVSFALITPSQVAQVWQNVFGSGSVATLVKSATDHGWNPSLLTFSMSATFAALIPAIFSWTGPAILGSFVAGDVRGPRKGMFYATIGSAIFVLAFQLIYIGGAVNAFGYQFVQQLDFGGPSLKLTPSIPLLGAVAWSTVSLVGVFIVVLGALTAFHSQPAGMFVASRILFSMSFDKTMPEKLADLNDRFITPIWNYLTILIVAIIIACLASPLSGIATYLTLGWGTFMGILALVLTNLAAVMLPITRRDLYNSADKLVSKTVAGIPIISVAGMIGFAGYFFALLVDGAVIAGSQFGQAALLIPTGAVVLGLIIYVYYVTRGYTSGIDMNLLYKEIPPE
jgi:amino acid transporter